MEMKCSICNQEDLNEVLTLRKSKIRSDLPKFQRLDKVCFSCGRMLARKNIYDFGNYWKCILLSVEPEHFRGRNFKYVESKIN